MTFLFSTIKYLRKVLITFTERLGSGGSLMVWSEFEFRNKISVTFHFGKMSDLEEKKKKKERKKILKNFVKGMGLLFLGPVRMFFRTCRKRI